MPKRLRYVSPCLLLVFAGLAHAEAPAYGELNCEPAWELAGGLGHGAPAVPALRDLGSYALAEADYSRCHLSAGVSHAQGRGQSQLTYYASLSYSFGFADVSAGLRGTQWRNLPIMPNGDPDAHAQFKRSFIDARFHPLEHTELGFAVEDGWGSSGSLWTARASTRIAKHGQTEWYGHLESTRIQYQDGAANTTQKKQLATLRLRHPFSRNVDLVGYAGWQRVTGAFGERPGAVGLVAFVFHQGYYDSEEVKHLGIKD